MPSKIPKYMTLVNWVRKKIDAGEIGTGDRLYSENELSVMFGVSRQTVRQAIGILEREHIVERRRGSGTYIIYTKDVQRVPTYNIGVITTYTDDYIFPGIIKGIEMILSRNGYTMQLAFTHNRLETEMQALKTMLDKDVDGFIIEPTKSSLPNPNINLYREIMQRKLPTIFFNSYYPSLPFHHVAMDDKAAGRIATLCLIDAGHEDICGIFQLDDLQGHLRYLGYIEALLSADIEIRDERVIWYSTEDKKDFTEYFPHILKRIQGCTGIVCYNDQIAFFMVEELRKNNIEVPNDISLIGIDNSELSTLCKVPFTSVAHPKEVLGITAAKNLLQLMGNPSFNATVDFMPELIHRSSVKKIKQTREDEIIWSKGLKNQF